MITHSELHKGIRIIIEGEPYEVLEARPLKKAQRRVVIQAKIKNLIGGSVFEKNFHQGDVFEEAEISKFQAKFIYSNKGKFVFSKTDNPSFRFELTQEQIGYSSQFLKANQEVETFEFENKIIGVSLPIKISLKITEAPPGVKGERAQPGTKLATLETGAKINVPLFVNEGDIIEINTETGEYSRRIE
ncbi:MAG: elongation factor P [Candidatus Nealsonbacteria bacterium]|nr:elongation factor P [Candidatus Nealsonbacteria bacterium]